MTDELKDSNDMQDQHVSNEANPEKTIPDSTTPSVSNVGLDDTDSHSPIKTSKGKIIGIVIAIVGALIVAILCMVFLVVIPSQQQAAIESAQDAMSQGNFDEAIAYLNDVGDSDKTKVLMNEAEKGKYYNDIMNKMFSSEGITEDDYDDITDAIEYMRNFHPNYSNLDMYASYLDAIKAEKEGNLYSAYQAYNFLGNSDFKDASEKANSLEQTVELLYNEGIDAYSKGDLTTAFEKFNQIVGYEDSKELRNKIESELNFNILTNDIAGMWGNFYLVGNLYYGYFMEFIPSESDVTSGTVKVNEYDWNTGEATIPIGEFSYNVLSDSKIHMTGRYNTLGGDPWSDFDGDVTVRIVSSANDSMNHITRTGRFLQLSPSPIKGRFGLSAWQDPATVLETLQNLNS